MRLQYETGIATFIQFVTLTLLNIPNGINSVVTTCHSDGTNCVSNLIVSLIFFILTAAWFAFVWIVGYTAQERRSRRFAQGLIVAEVLIMLVALLNAKNHTDWLSLTTSLVDLVLCLWVIVLALRLMKVGDNRVVKQRGKPRPRKRPTPKKSS